MAELKPLMAGTWEMSIGNLLIEPELLGEISPNYEEGTVEADTQVGKRSQPSGKADTAELTFTVYLPDMKYAGKILGYGDTAPISFGGGTCQSATPRPINIHPVCNGKDAKDDIHVYAGIVKMTFNPTLSTSDAVAMETTVMMQPNEDGKYMLLGYPDPSTPQYWDVTEQTWKAKAES